MGIDMYLEQSQLQSSSVATMCQSQVEAYQDLQSAIQKFSEDTESLKGDAYDSARSFFASVLLPLSKGGQLYAETFSQAIKKLPEDYQSMVRKLFSVIFQKVICRIYTGKKQNIFYKILLFKTIIYGIFV